MRVFLRRIMLSEAKHLWWASPLDWGPQMLRFTQHDMSEDDTHGMICLASYS